MQTQEVKGTILYLIYRAGGAYLEVEGLKKKSQRPFHMPQACKAQLGVCGALGASQRVQGRTLVGVQGVKPLESQRPQSILSTNFGLKSKFASCCKVRYKGASSLYSDKKKTGFIFATNIKCFFLKKTFYRKLVYKLQETKQRLKLSKKFVIVILQVFLVNFLNIRFLLSFDLVYKFAKAITWRH